MKISRKDGKLFINFKGKKYRLLTDASDKELSHGEIIRELLSILKTKQKKKSRQKMKQLVPQTSKIEGSTVIGTVDDPEQAKVLGVKTSHNTVKKLEEEKKLLEEKKKELENEKHLIKSAPKEVDDDKWLNSLIKYKFIQSFTTPTSSFSGPEVVPQIIELEDEEKSVASKIIDLNEELKNEEISKPQYDKKNARLQKQLQQKQDEIQKIKRDRLEELQKIKRDQIEELHKIKIEQIDAAQKSIKKTLNDNHEKEFKNKFDQLKNASTPGKKDLSLRQFINKHKTSPKFKDIKELKASHKMSKEQYASVRKIINEDPLLKKDMYDFLKVKYPESENVSSSSSTAPLIHVPHPIEIPLEPPEPLREEPIIPSPLVSPTPGAAEEEEAREPVAVEDDLYEDIDDDEGHEGTGIGDKSGLWNDEIDSLMTKYAKKGFKGTYCVDEIGEIPVSTHDKMISFVMNTMKKRDHGSGHWVAVVLTKGNLEYYDSFGEPPTKAFLKYVKPLIDRWSPDSMLQFKINNVKRQRNNSNNCGYFAVHFLQDRMKGKSYKEATGFKIIEDSLNGERMINHFKRNLIPFHYI